LKPSPPSTGAEATRHSWAQDLAELLKLRLTTLVLITTMAGFYLGQTEETPHGLAWAALAGTGLVAAGAAALNQLLEIRSDARMRRTRARPLPAGRMDERDVLFIGVLCSGLGLAVLGIVCNPLSALIATITLFTYIGLYTPLKRLSTLNTLVGAIPGALPPVIGYAAASGRIDPPAAALFALLFLWQMPHFLAIAWLYRDDYTAGGFRMLTLNDPQGHSTGFKSALYAALLIPVSAAPWKMGSASTAYLVIALLLGALYLAAAVRMASHPSPRSARTLFWASLAYLPLILLARVIDHAVA
jgi:protoheme IX farnesyltransferase